MRDAQAYNAIDYAILHSALATIMKMADAGADMGARDTYGWSYLHYAAYYEEHDIAQFLIKAGLDPAERDPLWHMSSLDLALYSAGKKISEEDKAVLVNIYGK